MLQKEFDDNLISLSGGDVNGKRFLLAVSGGIDSMCMASLFRSSRLNPHFGIAHVNFQLRPDDCFLDEELVREWAASHEVEFFSLRVDTKQYAHENSISTQMAARELRYNWFAQLLQEHRYDMLAVAHNQNDSVETLFLNLLRGTGIGGLSGIKSINGEIVRPLHSISRERIDEYVKSHDVPYRDDVTNFESHYSRNRIRNVVFPEFRKINPSFLSTVYRDTSYFTEASKIIDEVLESKKGDLFLETGDELIIDIGRIKESGHAGFWLFKLLSGRGFNGAQIEGIVAALDGQSGKIFQSHGYELVIDRGRMRVYPITSVDYSPIIVAAPGIYDFYGVSLKFDLFVRPENFDLKSVAGQLFFDAEMIKLPMICRSWRPADRFRPYGMSRGFKKISDFYTDLKLSRREKESQPLLLDGEEIVCIPPFRIDDRYKITTSTRIIGEVVIEN